MSASAPRGDLNPTQPMAYREICEKAICDRQGNWLNLNKASRRVNLAYAPPLFHRSSDNPTFGSHPGLMYRDTDEGIEQ